MAEMQREETTGEEKRRSEKGGKTVDDGRLYERSRDCMRGEKGSVEERRGYACVINCLLVFIPDGHYSFAIH